MTEKEEKEFMECATYLCIASFIEPFIVEEKNKGTKRTTYDLSDFYKKDKFDTEEEKEHVAEFNKLTDKIIRQIVKSYNKTDVCKITKTKDRRLYIEFIEKDEKEK